MQVSISQASIKYEVRTNYFEVPVSGYTYPKRIIKSNSQTPGRLELRYLIQARAFPTRFTNHHDSLRWAAWQPCRSNKIL